MNHCEGFAYQLIGQDVVRHDADIGKQWMLMASTGLRYHTTVRDYKDHRQEAIEEGKTIVF